jgi:hypothetical protein
MSPTATAALPVEIRIFSSLTDGKPHDQRRRFLQRLAAGWSCLTEPSRARPGRLVTWLAGAHDASEKRGGPESAAALTDALEN